MKTKDQISKLHNLAAELLNDTETRHYLFQHTQNEREYEAMRRALKTLAGTDLWNGSGNQENVRR